MRRPTRVTLCIQPMTKDEAEKFADSVASMIVTVVSATTQTETIQLGTTDDTRVTS